MVVNIKMEGWRWINMSYYKFYTINEPGKPETIRTFNKLTTARTNAKRLAKKNRTSYAIFGHVSPTKSEHVESYKWDVFEGLKSFKMRKIDGSVV